MKTTQIDTSDNVVVLLEDACKGETFIFNNQYITIDEDIPLGHKVAITNIKKGENIIKYGYPIGFATQDIRYGAHIHTHNVKTNLDQQLDYTYQPQIANQEINVINELKNNCFDIMQLPNTFWGFVRENGEVGIRNDLYIIPTVGCINNTAERIFRQFKQDNPEASVIFDNIIICKHSYGCSQMGDDHTTTRQFLANVALHPNAAAILVVGLGCENNSINTFREVIESGARETYEKLLYPNKTQQINNERIRFLVAQEVDDEILSGSQLLKELLVKAKQDKRVELPLSKLKIGLKCGGSDGLSGITANPLLGKFSDFIVQQGGTSALTEVPEMFGAETILMNRCVDISCFQKTVKLINNFKQYYLDNNMVVYENPSPGNKDGGITTLEDKSLGCTQKAGSAKVTDVINYGQRLKYNGLNLLQAPGNDLIASSALAAAGCHIVLFTTGRGNPYGTFVPTIKVASNTKLSQNKKKWIDFNAGIIVDTGMPKVIPSFIKLVVDIANGQKTLSELNGYQEIAIFKTGVTL